MPEEVIETVATPAPREEPSGLQLIQQVVERITPENAETMVGVIERLVALQRQMEADQARREFNRALAAFQAECPPVPHNKTGKIATRSGGGFAYTYADRAQIDRVAGPVMARHGLSRAFETTPGEKWLDVTCILRHASGHSESSTYRAREDTRDNPAISQAQKDSGLLTTGERRSLSSVLGISTSDEPDEPSEAPAPIDEQQVATIEAMLSEIAPKDTAAERARFLGWLGARSVETIPAFEYDRAIGGLEGRRKATR